MLEDSEDNTFQKFQSLSGNWLNHHLTKEAEEKAADTYTNTAFPSEALRVDPSL